MRVVLLMALAVLAQAACSPWWPSDGAQSTASSAVTLDSDDLNEGDWHPTWEDAALAEAKRLHPELEGLRAKRVHIRGVGERIYVEAEGGFCSVYGGMSLRHRWRANETSSC